MASVLWTMPVPSSGNLESRELRILPKRVCEVCLGYEDGEGQFVNCILRFIDVEAFKCTYLALLSVEMIESAYDCLVDLGKSAWLSEAANQAQSLGRPLDLRHLRLCLDDGPCYEFLCRNVEVSSEHTSHR